MPAKPGKHARREGRAESAPEASLLTRGLSTRVILLCLAAGILMFYSGALFDSAASIHWDAVDVHYSAQKYFADSLHTGHLPFWTPYSFSGMPFLANPEVGAWYPLNWPFFLIGITPKAIEWELALHCLIAALGAFLLARDLLKSRWAGVFCAVFYALSGFLAGHSSHLGIFQASALFPCVLWAGLRAARSYRWLPAVAIGAGLIVAAGHFQTALYAMCGLALGIAAGVVVRRASVVRAAAVLAAAAVGALLLPAVMTLPGIELTANSIRANANFSKEANATLVPGALATLVSPDRFGAPEVEHYSGPQDITQFYWYQGLLLLPLALAGLYRARERWYALALVVSAMWYAIGPAGGFYSLVSLLPGLHSVRSPVHDWFLASLGLALLAAAGIAILRARFSAPWIPIVLLVFTGCDLWYWNLSHNRLAYADQSFDELYGAPEERFAKVAAAAIPAGSMHRLWAPFDSPGFGPLNGALDTRTEVTYGYNPLTLTRYAGYIQAAGTNPKLLDGLAVTAKINPSTGIFEPNSTALGRVSVPSLVISVAGREAALSRLATLDPAREAIVEGAPAMAQSGPAEVSITQYDGASYRVHAHATGAALVRLAVPYFPGWGAELDGHVARVFPVDEALVGVIVPSGDHEIVFRYRSTWFATGMWISILASLLALAAGAWAAFRR